MLKANENKLPLAEVFYQQVAALKVALFKYQHKNSTLDGKNERPTSWGSEIIMREQDKRLPNFQIS